MGNVMIAFGFGRWVVGLNGPSAGPGGLRSAGREGPRKTPATTSEAGQTRHLNRINSTVGIPMI